MKRCELTVLWPEEFKVTATASNKLTAERRAAALACMRMKVSPDIFVTRPISLFMKMSYPK